jgi:hypothetical protein
LLGCCALVGDEGYFPVAFVHLLRGVSDDDETEIVEGQRAMPAAIHMEDEGEVAVTFGAGNGQVARHARTQIVAAARFEVITGNLPGGVRHWSLLACVLAR